MSRLHGELDTVIVGGGVLGNSIAYHLSERQKEGILVIEQNFPLSGTSGSTQAWVWVHTKTPSWYGEFSLLSSELYTFLEKKIGDVEFRRTGGMAPFFTEAEKETAMRLAETQAKVGIPIQVLTKEEVLAKEPAFSPNVVGATFSRVDGNVNPLRLVEMYMRSAKRNGVGYEYYNRVTSLTKNKGSFVITTDKDTFVSRNLILCGGPWSLELGKMLDVNIPIRPLRGQILITEPVAPMLNCTVNGMRQTTNGEILIGYSKEEAGFDRSSTLDVIQETANMAIKYVPSLAKANIVRCFSGIRAMPEDELPILGKIPSIENLYVAATHSGITLSPLIGMLMTELILDGETSIPINEYSIRRFEK